MQITRLSPKQEQKKENENNFKSKRRQLCFIGSCTISSSKILDSQPPDERNDPMLEFRNRFFELQRNLREDKDLNYYEDDSTKSN